MSIKQVRVRAVIEFGDISVATPNVINFNVNRTRNNPGSMSASIKVPIDYSGSNKDTSVVVKAGTVGNLKTIFTGDLKRVNVSPCWDDPKYVILNIEATDFLERLRDTKFTRRQVSYDHMFAIINSVEGAHRSSLFDANNAPNKFPMDPSVSRGQGLVGYGGAANYVEKGNDNLSNGKYSPIQPRLSLGRS